MTGLDLKLETRAARDDERIRRLGLSVLGVYILTAKGDKAPIEVM